jgi:hypothetical protein
MYPWFSIFMKKIKYLPLELHAACQFFHENGQLFQVFENNSHQGFC